MSDAVSVVIANFNMARFVEQAIRSALNQTTPPIEVIVVDDGSVDNSRDIIRGVAANDSRVVIVEQANAGQTRAKNAGLARARGTIVGFCDADDYWLPHKLEAQLPCFKSPEVALVYSRSRWVDPAGTVIKEVPERYSEGRVLEHLIVENFVPFGTALVRRDALTEIGGFDERYRMGIDWAAWLRLGRLYDFAYVDLVTYAYRVWDGQMSVNTGARFDAALRILTDFLGEYPGAVSDRVINRGFADTYANRALWLARTGGGVKLVTSNLLRSLRASPFESLGWKAVAKCLLGRA